LFFRNDDGTVYCGSHDTYLYAFYPNNGTVKWKFKTGNWVHGSPTIGNEGTIYIGSDDGYPYALYPNNGTMKWSFDPGSNSGILGSSAAISFDGTIYFGTCVDIGYTGGGDIITLTLDGTEKWRKRIANDWVHSSPAIDADGNVYIGSASCVSGNDFGYLHAIGSLDPDAPSAPAIDGPTNGKVGTEYDYTFISTSPLGNDVYYYIEWGDGAIEEWQGPYDSGDVATFSHTWSTKGTYTIKARAKDTDNLWDPWGEFTANIKSKKQSIL